MQWYMVHCH